MKKLQKVLLFFLLFGTMAIFGMVENIKGVSYPLIKAEFAATDVQQGFMVSMLSMAYVAFCVIAGLFLGRFGTKPSFLFGYAAVSMGIFAVFFMREYFFTVAALFIVFAGLGFFEIGINALAANVFQKKTALMMNILHSLYGVGSILGPIAAGAIIAHPQLISMSQGVPPWRYAYIFTLPLALVLLITAIITRFPGSTDESKLSDDLPAPRKSFFDALRSPMVWLMSVTLGLAVIVEMNSANWGSLYFHEVYGLDPAREGARFLSAFFLLFTVSRLVCGLFIEKIGYTRALLGVAAITTAIFITGFFLGANGIFVLPAIGFFVALLWPTIMATGVVLFGKDAPVYCSAMIAIGGFINTLVQFIIGYTNKLFGPAWGYRSSIVYAILLIFMLIILHRKFLQQPRP